MLDRNGVPSLEQIRSRFPEERYLVKHKAIAECYEAIPCNPCSTSCPFGAILIGEDINNHPKVDFDKCTGCGICVYSCPGLAIFTVKMMENHLEFKIPYEFVPYPKQGEIMNSVNRNGDIIGECEILKVENKLRQDRTVILHVKVDKNQLYDFITVRRKS